ncbi:MAG: malic enzyme-like NAD(P)-binding protein [Clostridia bacterium]
MGYEEASVALHLAARGKLEMVSRVPLATQEDLSLAYTPGVAEPCRLIQQDVNLAYDLTRKWNTVAIISDGTAVLGLGDIGPEAALPVMEGKAILFKGFGGVDAFPICLNTKDPAEIIRIVHAMEPSIGGVNLEDIASPNCFIIERKLKELCNIPIFHDDQHGTAIVTAAALINALKLVKKSLSEIKLVLNGAGAAGIAITKLLSDLGVKHIIACDRSGALYAGRAENMNAEKNMLAAITNDSKLSGSLATVMIGADVFVGVSAANCVTPAMVASMNEHPIILAMANPDPEIMPDLAKSAGARVVCTGRSDFPNQVNNVLAFPGVFRGALDVRAKDINEEMKKAAAYALAGLIAENELSEDYVIPSPFDPRVCTAVASAVAAAARKSGVARI